MNASNPLDTNFDKPIIRDTTRLRFPPDDGNNHGQDCVDLLIRRGQPLSHLGPSMPPSAADTAHPPWSRVSWPWDSNGMQAAGRSRSRWPSNAPQVNDD
ncbi:MAG: hypothetical protein EKK45_22840 [Curvibacter sp.]|nr:MAG: hypothetical protein EKK45_22840 [Curvibacter sp.]